jgi:hypothetical protein
MWKTWYLGDAIRISNIDISYWDDYGVYDVIEKFIECKVELIWKHDGYNWFPDHLEHNRSKFAKAIKHLRE